MNIIITNIQHYVDLPSGSSRLAHDQAVFMAAAGHSVTVIAPGDTEHSETEMLGPLLLLRYKPRQLSARDPRRTWAHQEAAIEVLQKHVKGHVDVVHGHAPLNYVAASQLYPKANKIYSIHSPATMEMELNWSEATVSNTLKRWLGLPILKRLERKCLETSDFITSDSEFTREQIGRIYGRHIAQRIKVIPGWVDFERFKILQDAIGVKQSLGWPTDIPVLFTLRRLVPRMGLDRLVRAAKIVQEKGHKFRLVIAGTGPLRKELENLTRDLRMTDTITYAGLVPDHDLPLMYGACDAFILPTAALECFGLIILEALACGRPVLATPIAAIPELISKFEPKWLARAADEESIASLMVEHLEGRLPYHMPSELRRKARQNYDAAIPLGAMLRLASKELLQGEKVQ